MDLEEAPAQMRPPEGEHDRAVVARSPQRFEAGKAIDLQHATEAGKMGGRADAPAVRGVEGSDRRWPGAAIGAVVHGVPGRS